MTKSVGTTSEVLSAFVDGRSLHTTSAPVPGGYRVASRDNGDGTTDLYSYRTVVARRLADGRVAITTRRYSVTTSKLVGQLARRMGGATGELVEVTAQVPGRWGGYGPAWHATGYETLPFVVFGR